MLDDEGQELSCKKRQRTLSALIEGSTVIAAITALLFTLGWIYLSEYYSVFGLDIQSLDLPLYAPLEASLNPIVAFQIASSAKVWLLLVGIVAVGALRFFWLLYYARVYLWLRNSSEPFERKLLTLTLPLRITFRRYTRVPRALRVDRKELTRAFNDHLIMGARKWLVRISQFTTLGLIPLFILFAAGRAGQKQACKDQEHPRFKTEIIFKADASARLRTDLMKANSNGELRILTETKDLVVVFSKNRSSLGGAKTFMFPIGNIVSVQNEVLVPNLAHQSKQLKPSKKLPN